MLPLTRTPRTVGTHPLAAAAHLDPSHRWIASCRHPDPSHCFIGLPPHPDVSLNSHGGRGNSPRRVERTSSAHALTAWSEVLAIRTNICIPDSSVPSLRVVDIPSFGPLLKGGICRVPALQAAGSHGLGCRKQCSGVSDVPRDPSLSSPSAGSRKTLGTQALAVEIRGLATALLRCVWGGSKQYKLG